MPLLCEAAFFITPEDVGLCSRPKAPWKGEAVTRQLAGNVGRGKTSLWVFPSELLLVPQRLDGVKMRGFAGGVDASEKRHEHGEGEHPDHKRRGGQE